MVEEINQVIFEITNAHWNRIVRYLMTKYQQEFYEFPAAKRNHHAFANGLAYHTVSMLRLGKAIAKEYTEINTSLLYAGIILHDLGKVLELSGAITTEYTVAGNLIGHLVLVDEEITKACLALKIDDREEDVVVLRHMVLAHHGLLEYGSPVRPRIMEAEILHQIDTMDASIQMMLGAIRQTQPGEYTERIFGLDNRSFYVPKITKGSGQSTTLFYAYLEEDSVVLLEESVAFSESLVLVSLVLESLDFDSFSLKKRLKIQFACSLLKRS